MYEAILKGRNILVVLFSYVYIYTFSLVFCVRGFLTVVSSIRTIELSRVKVVQNRNFKITKNVSCVISWG